MLRVLIFAVCGLLVGAAEASERWVRAFDGCEELRGYMVRTAVRSARLRMQQGLYYPAWDSGSTVILPDEPRGDMDFAASPAAGGAVEHSDTNVQVQGVDELDLIKTTGDYVFLVANGLLQVADSWPAEDARMVAQAEVEGSPVGLMLWQDRLAVVSVLFDWAVGEPARMATDIAPMPSSTPTTKVTVFDISDPAAPAVEREVYLEGSFNTARRIDSRLHLVVANSLPVYAYDMGFPVDRAKGVRSELRHYAADLMGRPLRDLAPEYADRRYHALETSQRTGILGGCADYARPEVPNGTATTSVVTLDLAAPDSPLRSATLVSDYGTVYASAENLYIVTANAGPWMWLDAAGQPQDVSTVHKVSLGASPVLEATGEVDGWIINRYAMSEYEGVLRIATTLGQWSAAPLNRLFTLGQFEQRLEEIGHSEPLGHEGERIYAVRFDGPRGYVVTFEQTDPLYTLDLSDPEAPVVAGELEIPGFSTYLHPMGSDRLLAMGQSTDPQGAELSLFDISNFASPSLLDRVFLGSGTYSEAQYEPKAFTYYEPLGRLVIPVSRYGYVLDAEDAPQSIPEGFNGAMVFDVDPLLGFALAGSVEHRLDTDSPYYWNPVRRSLFVGQDGEYALYTLSAQSLQASDADTLAPLSEMPLAESDSTRPPPIVLF